jgi:outer membrane protein OmpA-like peptidoglycan-associated protein
MMTTRLLKIALVVAQLPLLGGSAFAQMPSTPPTAPLAYAGGDTMLGAGYDSRYKLRGEVTQAFAGDESSAWLGGFWLGDQAGGLKLDYYWLVDDGARVAKVFAAWDRNRWNDQKATVGTGAEYESWFWGAYLSAGFSGRRDAGTASASVTQTLSGSDAIGSYLQDVTTTTTVRSFDQVYDHGLGARLGHFYEDALIRLTVGADHEWGTASSRQTTVSVGAEKFFAGSPHSILLTAAASNRSGDFETHRRDHQVGIYWRYEFGGKHGGNWQPSKNYRQVDDIPAAAQSSPATESAPGLQKNVIKVTEMVAAETFFDFDRATLRPEAHGILDDLAVRLKNASLQGPLQITGHTCDLGPAAYNQRLSERRAAAVRSYLIAQGALPADRIVATGKGEDDPKYPNTRADRAKNRRCEIEFAVVTDRLSEVATAAALAPAPAPVPAAAGWHYVEEPVTSLWIERALRNPVTHKREVDAYRTQETTVTTTEGTRTYLAAPPVTPPPGNHPPIAQDDWYTWYGSHLPAILNVLGNDSDPDNNAIHVVSVTQSLNGVVTILPDGQLRYMWRHIQEGVDRFTYTIADPSGATSTANVTLNIVDP